MKCRKIKKPDKEKYKVESTNHFLGFGYSGGRSLLSSALCLLRWLPEFSITPTKTLAAIGLDQEQDQDQAHFWPISVQNKIA